MASWRIEFRAVREHPKTWGVGLIFLVAEWIHFTLFMITSLDDPLYEGLCESGVL